MDHGWDLGVTGDQLYHQPEALDHKLRSSMGMAADHCVAAHHGHDAVFDALHFQGRLLLPQVCSRTAQKGAAGVGKGLNGRMDFSFLIS